MNVNDFLVWLVGGGCITAAMWVLGQFNWYNTLVEKTKQLIFFGTAVVFGSGAYAIINYVPETFIIALTPYFLIVSAVFSYIFLNKMYEKVSKMYTITMMREKERIEKDKKGK